jgi:hypothetical protein
VQNWISGGATQLEDPLLKRLAEQRCELIRGEPRALTAGITQRRFDLPIRKKQKDDRNEREKGGREQWQPPPQRVPEPRRPTRRGDEGHRSSLC